jgi:hypothetical protein
MSSDTSQDLEKKVKELEDGFRVLLVWEAEKRPGESEPARIRDLGRLLGVQSPSDYRFESALDDARTRLKQVDPSNPLADDKRTGRIKAEMKVSRPPDRKESIRPKRSGGAIMLYVLVYLVGQVLFCYAMGSGFFSRSFSMDRLMADGLVAAFGSGSPLVTVVNVVIFVALGWIAGYGSLVFGIIFLIIHFI